MPIIDLNQGIPNKVNKSSVKKADIKNTFNETTAWLSIAPDCSYQGCLLAL